CARNSSVPRRAGWRPASPGSPPTGASSPIRTSRRRSCRAWRATPRGPRSSRRSRTARARRTGSRPLWGSASSTSPGGSSTSARLQEVAERAAAAERGGEGIRLLSRIVFEELPEALVVVDSSLDVLDANPAALRLFGIPALPHSLLDLVRSAEVLGAFRDAIA